jgi:hypothetical protein
MSNEVTNVILVVSHTCMTAVIIWWFSECAC